MECPSTECTRKPGTSTIDLSLEKSSTHDTPFHVQCFVYIMYKPQSHGLETGLYNRGALALDQSVSLTSRPPGRQATPAVMRSSPSWRQKVRSHQPYPRGWRHRTPREPLSSGMITRTLFWALPCSTCVGSAPLLHARKPITSGMTEVSNTTTPGESKVPIDTSLKTLGHILNIQVLVYTVRYKILSRNIRILLLYHWICNMSDRCGVKWSHVEACTVPGLALVST